MITRLRCLKCLKIIECKPYDTVVLLSHIRLAHPEIKLPDDDTFAVRSEGDKEDQPEKLDELKRKFSNTDEKAALPSEKLLEPLLPKQEKPNTTTSENRREYPQIVQCRQVTDLKNESRFPEKTAAPPSTVTSVKEINGVSVKNNSLKSSQSALQIPSLPSIHSDQTYRLAQSQSSISRKEQPLPRKEQSLPRSNRNSVSVMSHHSAALMQEASTCTQPIECREQGTFISPSLPGQKKGILSREDRATCISNMLLVSQKNSVDAIKNELIQPNFAEDKPLDDEPRTLFDRKAVFSSKISGSSNSTIAEKFIPDGKLNAVAEKYSKAGIPSQTCTVHKPGKSSIGQVNKNPSPSSINQQHYATTIASNLVNKQRKEQDSIGKANNKSSDSTISNEMYKENRKNYERRQRCNTTQNYQPHVKGKSKRNAAYDIRSIYPNTTTSKRSAAAHRKVAKDNPIKSNTSNRHTKTFPKRLVLANRKIYQHPRDVIIDEQWYPIYFDNDFSFIRKSTPTKPQSIPDIPGIPLIVAQSDAHFQAPQNMEFSKTESPINHSTKPKPQSRHRTRCRQRRGMYRTSIETWDPVKGTIFCPKCGSDKQPFVRTKKVKIAYSSYGAACILTCWPLCFLPCIYPAPTKKYLHCAECHNFLGMYDEEHNCIRPNRKFIDPRISSKPNDDELIEKPKHAEDDIAKLDMPQENSRNGTIDDNIKNASNTGSKIDKEP